MGIADGIDKVAASSAMDPMAVKHEIASTARTRAPPGRDGAADPRIIAS
jgi:hypothetical protein